MSWRVTVVLAVVFLAASLYAYFDVISDQPDASWQTLFREPRPTPPAQQVTRLLSFEPSEITTIHLQRGPVSVQVHRDGGSWTGASRGQALDDLLQHLLELAEIMPLDVPQDSLASHGLDPPEGTIELIRKDEPPVVILIGQRNPPATGVYVQVGRGGPVALTGALILWEFEKAIRAITEPN